MYIFFYWDALVESSTVQKTKCGNVYYIKYSTIYSNKIRISYYFKYSSMYYITYSTGYKIKYNKALDTVHSFAQTSRGLPPANNLSLSSVFTTEQRWTLGDGKGVFTKFNFTYLTKSPPHYGLSSYANWKR